jgi:hypothetical protein
LRIDVLRHDYALLSCLISLNNVALACAGNSKEPTFAKAAKAGNQQNTIFPHHRTIAQPTIWLTAESHDRILLFHPPRSEERKTRAL